MGLPEPITGKHTLYDGTQVEGIAVRLPGWRHPLAIDTKTGVAKYDNYGGSWGAQSHLDKFTQLYAANKATHEIQRLGLRAMRQTLPSGAIKITASGYR